MFMFPLLLFWQFLAILVVLSLTNGLRLRLGVDKKSPWSLLERFGSQNLQENLMFGDCY